MPRFLSERLKPTLAGYGPAAWPVLADAVATLSRRFAARRDPALARQFLAACWDAPRFWLYGAGTHSAALLDAFAPAWRGRLVGIIDRDPNGRTTLDGVTIRAIAAAIDDGAPILVAHPFYESEMAEGLVAAGIDSARIHQLYGDPDFIALSRRSLPAVERDVRSVILGSTRYTTVPDSELATVLDPATTRYLAFDLFEASEPRPPYIVIPTDKSIDAIVAALESLRPELVYLRTKIETDFLAYLVRRVLPDCIIVHEVWDFSIVFEDATLKNWLKLPDLMIETSRLAEVWSVDDASSIVISKWGGPEWSTLFADRDGTALYFGGITKAPALPPYRPGSGAVRLLYAGLLPKPEDLDAMDYDYNFLDRLERLARTGAAEVTILNSAHEDAAMDVVYRAYHERFARAGITYRPRVGYGELMAIAAAHDFGWLALDRRDHWDMGKGWIVPMRFTGYVEAGLPVIVGPPWDLCVDLVTRFGAGVVFGGDGDDALIAALVGADIARLRDGVREMRAHMLASNQHVLSLVSGLPADARRGIGGPQSPQRGAAG